MKTVLLIDDNEDYRETARHVLEDEGLEVHAVDCPDSAFTLLETIGQPDLIMCDLFMPFTTGDDSAEYETSVRVGVKTVQELAWVYPETPVVALTAMENIDIAGVRKDIAPIPAYQKPQRLSEMVELVRYYLMSKDWGGMQ
jgi:CheY-like chemotaxis protein